MSARSATTAAPGGAGVAPPWRLPLLAAGLVSMVAGALAGLSRAGLPVAPVAPDLVGLHAVLMIGGFFGSVIGLERAVAHGARWAYLAPLASAAAAVTLLAGGPTTVIAALQLAAGCLLTFASWRLHLRQPSLHSSVLVAAAACWPLGTLAWATTGVAAGSLALWTDFLVLTIAGERLELSRLMPPAPRARRVFVGLLAACLAFALAAACVPAAMAVPLGAGHLALAVWLVRHDIARRTARSSGLTGFIGRALLAGYAWLAAGGVLLAANGLADVPLLHDAALHAILVGFVMSMVFGHAPIIFPAVVRAKVPYHPVFYVPLVLLHGSVLLRVAADLAGSADGRAAGAAGNALALAAFIAVTVSAVVRGARARRS